MEYKYRTPLFSVVNWNQKNTTYANPFQQEFLPTRNNVNMHQWQMAWCVQYFLQLQCTQKLLTWKGEWEKMFNACKFETVLWWKILGSWLWSLKTREFRYTVHEKSGPLSTWKCKGNSENEGQLYMKNSSINRGQNRSQTHVVSCLQRTQIVTHLTICNTFGYNLEKSICHTSGRKR